MDTVVTFDLVFQVEPTGPVTLHLTPPAALLGRETGTLEVGKRADAIVVAGNPLADVSALRDVRLR